MPTFIYYFLNKINNIITGYRQYMITNNYYNFTNSGLWLYLPTIINRMHDE